MKHKKTYADMERHPGDMSDFRCPAYSVRHPDTEYRNIQNMSTGQQNEAQYIKSEYGTHKPSAAALIRAQGEQIRRVTAEEYLKDKIGSDADGQESNLRVRGCESAGEGDGGRHTE